MSGDEETEPSFCLCFIVASDTTSFAFLPFLGGDFERMTF
jgi:hypothetical protein